MYTYTYAYCTYTYTYTCQVALAPPDAVLGGDWVEYTHEVDGRKYFYNTATGQTSWRRPQEGSSSS